MTTAHASGLPVYAPVTTQACKKAADKPNCTLVNERVDRGGPPRNLIVAFG